MIPLITLMSRALPLLCLLLASAAPAEESGVRLKARLDWSEHEAVTRKGRWHPVHVEVDNRSGKDIEGKVWAEVEVGNGKVLDVRYQRPVTLPKDAKKRFVLEVRLEGGESSVFVHADIGGFSAIRALPILWAEEDVDPILVVGKWPKAYLKRIERRSPGPDLEKCYPQRYVTLAEAEDLPDSWRGLDGLETIVWDGVEMRDLSVAQAQAIEDWVAMGGSLVVSGGDAMESCYKSPLGRFLPGRYVDRVEVDVEAQLARKVGLTPPRTTEKLLAARIGGVDAPSWATEEGVPLLLERREGLGRVCVVPFDLACEQTMASKGSDLLLDYLVGHRGFSIMRGGHDSTPWPVRAYPGTVTRPFPATRTYSNIPQREPSLMPDQPLDASLPTSFRFSSGVRVPPARHIATFLCLYVVACLANMLVWRVAHRREFAWASLMALSLGFAGYAWRDAALNAQAAPSAQHVTVIELGPDGHGGRRTSWFGFFTTISQDVQVASSGPREALSLLEWDRVSAIGDSHVEVTEDGRAPRIPELPLLPRSVSCVKTEGAAPAEASVAVRTEAEGSDILVTVVPPSWGTPLAPILVHGAGAAFLDESLPGGAFRGRLRVALAQEIARTEATFEEVLAGSGLAPEMAEAIATAAFQRPRDGSLSYVVVPILDAPSRIGWGGQQVEVDRGVTLFIVPMRWEGCLSRSTPSLTPFCRRIVCEKKDQFVVWEMTPLWRDGPGVTDNRGRDYTLASFFVWKTGSWVDAWPPSWGYHPFSRAVRLRQTLEGNYWGVDDCESASFLPPPELYPQ